MTLRGPEIAPGSSPKPCLKNGGGGAPETPFFRAEGGLSNTPHFQARPMSISLRGDCTTLTPRTASGAFVLDRCRFSEFVRFGVFSFGVRAQRCVPTFRRVHPSGGMGGGC